LSNQKKPIMKKQLKINDVSFQIYAINEDVPVKGNAIASGDDAFDRKVENRIIRELENGNVWAWCTVEVKAIYKELSASDYLGCCSYKHEKDFMKKGGYYHGMKERAFDELKKKVDEILNDLCDCEEG
jgi:hypothetical protein